MKQLPLIIIIGFLLSGCLTKPKACLELEDVYEVGRQYTLTSCSENFEFLTWDFQDQSGFIGDEAVHTFANSGERTITLTAYGKGGYRSDAATHKMKSARRFVHYIEIISEVDYSKYSFKFDLTGINFLNSTGTSPEDEPFVGNVFDQVQIRIPISPATIVVKGTQSGSEYLLIDERINFETNDDNPLVLDNGQNFITKVYWKYE
jgi:hypothetical protein